MNELLKLTVNIFALVILGTLIEQFITNDKPARFVKPAIATAIIITIITGVSKIDFTNNEIFSVDDQYIDTESVWHTAEQNSESMLEKHMMKLCIDNLLDINEITVDITTDMSTFEVKSVTIQGKDKNAAKNLIAGYYGIGIAYININGE